METDFNSETDKWFDQIADVSQMYFEDTLDDLLPVKAYIRELVKIAKSYKYSYSDYDKLMVSQAFSNLQAVLDQMKQTVDARFFDEYFANLNDMMKNLKLYIDEFSDVKYMKKEFMSMFRQAMLYYEGK